MISTTDGPDVLLASQKLWDAQKQKMLLIIILNCQTYINVLHVLPWEPHIRLQIFSWRGENFEI